MVIYFNTVHWSRSLQAALLLLFGTGCFAVPWQGFLLPKFKLSFFLLPVTSSPFSVCLFLVLEMFYQPFFVLTIRKIFDIIEQLDHKTRVPFERQLASIGQAVRLALEEIERMLDRCDYGWVRLSDIAISIWLGMVVLHWDLSSFPGAVIIPCNQGKVWFNG